MAWTLYYGDNLDVLRRHVASESAGLVYLASPFQSRRNDNVLLPGYRRPHVVPRMEA